MATATKIVSSKSVGGGADKMFFYSTNSSRLIMALHNVVKIEAV